MVGSLRAESFNRKIYNSYVSYAEPGTEFIEVPVGDFPLYNADLHRNEFPKVALDASRIIASADGVIFFSPEYNYSIPGVLKNAIDWISRLDPMPFNRKACSVIGGSPGNIGTARMQYDLRKSGVFLNMHFLNSPEVMIGRVHEKFDERGELADEATIHHLKRHFTAFRDFVDKTK